MTRRAGYLFISCPAATTPMHFDVEHSFLLQVKGIEARQRRRLRPRPRRCASASSTATSTARTATSRRCSRPAVTTRLEPGVGVYLRRTSRTGSRRRPASPSRSRSRSSPPTPSGRRACRGSTSGCASSTSRRSRWGNQSASTGQRSRCSNPCRSSAETKKRTHKELRGSSEIESQPGAWK